MVDFGSGAVLDHVHELGVEQVTDVLVTHHHRDQVQGLARARTAGARIWVPPHRAGADRRRRRALADTAARQRLRPPPRPLLTARAGTGDGGGDGVPNGALRARRGLRIANAGPHGRVGDLPRRRRRTQACVLRRSRAWRRQGLVARRDAVVVQRHRRAGGDVLLLRRPRAEGAGCSPACPRGAGRGSGRDARACPRADRGAGGDAARGSLAP